MEILELMSRGLSNRDICGALNISSNTVKVHVAAVLKALNVANRTEATFIYKGLLQNQAATGARARAASRIGRPAIAVLAFTPIGSRSATADLCEGLAQDLITRLAGWRWFPVIAHHSSSRYTQADLQAIRDELNVQYAVAGSVQVASGRARISVQLVETERGECLWTDALDVQLEDVLHTQDQVAQRLVASLSPELINAEGQAADVDTPDDFQAWRITMRGMWFLNKRTPADVSSAADHFATAIRRNDRFSLPWYGQCWVHHHRVVEQWTDDVDTELKRLREAAQRCFELAPNSASGHLVVGMTDVLTGKPERAVAHLEQAVTLNPSSGRAQSLLGQCYALAGNVDEGIAALEEALQLNPMNQRAWTYQGVIGLAHFAARRYDDAIAWAQRALTGRPDMITAQLTIIAALHERGDAAAAADQLRQLQQLRAGFRPEEYLRLIARTARPDYVLRLQQAFDAAAS